MEVIKANFVVTSLSLLLQLFVPPAVSMEESFCAGTGANKLYGKAKGFKSMGWEANQDATILPFWVTKHYDTTVITEINTVTGIFQIYLYAVEDPNRIPGINRHLNGWVGMTVSKATAADSNKNDYITALAVWAVTDTREVVGNFVSEDEAQSCYDNPIPISDYIIPCSATPKTSSANPSMFIYTDNMKNKVTVLNLVWKMSQTTCDMPKKFRFIFAMNARNWTKDNPGSLDPIADVKKSLGPIIQASHWIPPTYYGAADAVFPPEYRPEGKLEGVKLTCVTRILSGWPKVPWVYNGRVPNELAFYPNYENEKFWMKNHWNKDGSLNKDVLLSRTVCRAADDGYVSFGGRCTEQMKDERKTVFGEERGLPQCDSSAYDYLHTTDGDIQLRQVGTYEDYIASNRSDVRLFPNVAHVIEEIETGKPKFSTYDGTTKKRSIQEDQDAYADDSEIKTKPGQDGRKEESLPVMPVPTTPQGENDQSNSTITITKATRKPFTKKPRHNKTSDWHLACKSRKFSRVHELGLCVQTTAGKIIYGVRQWHALAGLVCTVIVNPISTYTARFLKGVVFPTRHVQLPIKQWYIVHACLMLPLICMYGTGMAAISRQIKTYGRSTTSAASFHTIAGHILSVLPLIQVLTGLLRPVHMGFRKAMMIAHWLVGVIFNYGCVILCATTFLIPGSPTSFVSLLKTEAFGKLISHPIPMVLLCWLVIDLIFQFYMTVNIVLFDRSNNFKRASYFPVIIPLVLDNEDRNVNNYQIVLKHDAFQKKVFYFYVFICGLVFACIVILMYVFTNPLKHGYGPLTCTHDKDGRYHIPEIFDWSHEVYHLCH